MGAYYAHRGLLRAVAPAPNGGTEVWPDAPRMTFEDALYAVRRHPDSSLGATRPDDPAWNRHYVTYCIASESHSSPNRRLTMIQREPDGTEARFSATQFLNRSDYSSSDWIVLAGNGPALIDDPEQEEPSDDGGMWFDDALRTVKRGYLCDRRHLSVKGSREGVLEAGWCLQWGSKGLVAVRYDRSGVPCEVGEPEKILTIDERLVQKVWTVAGV